MMAIIPIDEIEDSIDTNQPVETDKTKSVEKSNQTSKIIPISEIPDDNVETKKTLAQAVPNVPIPIRNSILGPLVEVTRGLYKGGGSFYDKLSGVTKFAQNTLGLEPTGGIFKQWSDSLLQSAENLPDTQMAGIPKTIYEMIGGAVPTITEFATVSKIPGLGNIGKLSQVGQFSLLNALDEYDKNPELKNLREGAITGAEMGMAFPIASKGISLLKSGGKSVAEAYINFVTGKPSLAKDFVNNPKKYNVNVFGKTKDSSEIEQQLNNELNTIKSEIENKKFVFKENKKRNQQILDMKFNDSVSNLKNANEMALQSTKEKGKISLDEATAIADEAIATNKQLIQEKAISIFDSSLKEYGIIKEEAGKKVGAALNSVMEKDPLVSIPGGFVMPKLTKITKEFPLFKYENGNWIQKTAAGNPQEARVFNNIFTEIRSRTANEQLSLGYLQDLKGDLRTLAQSSAKSNPTLSKMYGELSEAVNPAQLAEDYVMIAPGVTSSLKELAKANKEFTVLKKSYDKAMNQYFYKSGDSYIPNLNRVIKAISGNDQLALREMKLADMALPVESRLLPKISKLAKDSNQLEIQQKSIVKNLKRKAELEYKEVYDASRKSLAELQKNQHKMILEEKNQTAREIFNFMKQKDKEYGVIKNAFNTQIEQSKNNEILKRFTPVGGGASLLQHLLGFGALGSAKYGNAGQAVGLGVTTIGLSPVVASNLVNASRPIGTGLTGLSKASGDPLLQKLLGSRILRNKKSQ